MMFYEIWVLALKTRTIAMIKYPTNCHPQDCPACGPYEHPHRFAPSSAAKFAGRNAM